MKKFDEKLDVYLAGIGGSGVMSLGYWAMKSIEQVLDNRLTITLCEVHGLAQRGGSVYAHLRVYPKEDNLSPTIPRADDSQDSGVNFLIGTELQETGRSIKYSTKNKTCIITNLEREATMHTLTTPGAMMPSKEELVKSLYKISKELIAVEASNIAKERLGNTLYGNAILLGVLASKLPIEEEVFLEMLKETKKGVEKNLSAFKIGYKWMG